MEISPTKNWERKEWEMHVNDLLRIKHGQENYISIPDLHNGDAGIEGYSLCGNAYQAYCPDELGSLSDLYEKQRDKLTVDIDKFISDKENKLSKIFGKTKIKRWVLVVPRHISRHLNAHATSKTEEVLSCPPPYVDESDFHILVWDRSNFKLEESNLLEQGVRVLKLDKIEVSSDAINAFQNDKSNFVENIETKLYKLKKVAPEQIRKARDTMLKNAIYSQNMLSDLKQEYPEYHSQIVSGVMEREEMLPLELFNSEQKSPAEQIATLKNLLSRKSRLHEDNLECIASGTIADWLMRCDLDFE